MLIKRCTASGEEHGLINTISNQVADKGDSQVNAKIKSSYEKKRKDDARPVKARYINHRGVTERLEKVYCRYAGDPIQVYRLIPGHTYELPMGFIEEVNGIEIVKRSGLQSVDGQNVTSDGEPLAKDGRGLAIHELIPVSF